MSQRLEVNLDVSGLEAVYRPADQKIDNQAGSFTIAVEANGDRISVARELELAKAVYGPEEWPSLRTLLLADKHERNQTLLLKTAEDDKKELGDSATGE
jgi:hypothetical protein